MGSLKTFQPTGLLVIFVAAFICQSCATNPNIPIVEQVPTPEMQGLPQELSSRPLLLDRVIVDPGRGAIIGEYRRGNRCINPQPIVWKSGAQEYKKGSYHLEFDKVLAQYNFRLRGKTDSLFEPSMPTVDELLIGALITSVKESSCYAVDIWHVGPGIYKGSVRLSVRWEVYSLVGKKVVFSLDTEGSGIGDEFKPLWEHDYYSKAFGNALRGLLKNAEFRKLVLSPNPLEQRPKTEL